MPDWLPSVAIAAVAIVVMIWLVRRVAPGWFPEDPAPVAGLRRRVSRERTIMTWGAVILAALVLVWLLYDVFSQASPR